MSKAKKPMKQPGVRTPDESGTSRVKLLQAGLDVFSRHGYHGATTKMIAASAGVNEALIMRHYQSKEGLFLAVLAHKKREAMQAENYVEHETLEEELVSYGRQRLDADCRAGEFLRLLISQLISEDDFATKVKKTLEVEFCGRMVARLRHFKRKGQLHKSASIDDVALMIDKQILVTFLVNFLVIKTTIVQAQRELELAMRTLAMGLQFKARAGKKA